jgi:hypothetical protein
VGIFSSLNAKMISSTFQKDFDEFRTAPVHDQIAVGKRIWADLEEFAKWNLPTLNENQVRLRSHYKALRHSAMTAGAQNACDPGYAYAALMESLVCALGDQKVFTKIMNDIKGWLALIGVISRDSR